MNRFNLKEVFDRFTRLKKELPRVIANQAQNYFVRAFTSQAWDGDKWKEVKRRTPGTPEYKYPKFKGLSRRTTPILVLSGRLRRAVSNSIKIARWDRIQLLVEAPGAIALNEGDESRNLDARPYMKHSDILDAEIQAKITKYVDKIWFN